MIKLPNLKLDNMLSIADAFKPQIPIVPKAESIRMPSVLDNIKNMNNLRELDNLSYQIKIKETQKNIYEKRLSCLKTSSDIKKGIIISLLIIVFSVIIPFFIVAFNNWLKPLKLIIFIYLLITFSLSMVSMVIYLLHFFRKDS